jgi:Flp pilus assembly protein TadB
LARQKEAWEREEARRASPYWKLFYFLLILLPFLVVVGLFAVGWWPIGAALFFVILGALPYNPVLHGMKR